MFIHQNGRSQFTAKVLLVAAVKLNSAYYSLYELVLHERFVYLAVLFTVDKQ